ncbi:C6 zinc finger domain-containing protein [Colletotrichum higginsianum IMI 349063]|uniref:C6 zinc finger domain-containing protein n=2 Tax=Colletotrichum higginsianum TaxID=80884 RepID=A0A1B7XWK5_COLHI|nr:C6 zinc finger domain-containing protein [Colletotrichum higginsianum IMI 349063]OBR04153.1 C6 zinc finger domain-containing protein [Colletotrichum higginsianum IMI 349063]TIC90340.1 putative transcription factor gsfR1 [Colletotrichum higginsianum]
MTTDQSSSNNTNTSRPTASERRAAAAKRRFVRKGTKSCWECRRRKIRCIFDDKGPPDTCRTCWEKGAPCISQEFPEEEARSAPAPAGGLGDRLGRVERLVERLYRRIDDLEAPASASPKKEEESRDGSTPTWEAPVNACSPRHAGGRPAGAEIPGPSPLDTGGNDTLNRAHVGPPSQGPNDAGFSANAQLRAYSRQLSAAIPPPEDCRDIYKLYSDADLVFQAIFVPYCLLGSLEPESVEHFMDSLREPMHPVLLAKRMLMVAAMLQRLPANRPVKPGVSESSFRIMEKLAETAIGVVCEANALMGTLEALECVVLQTAYLVNSGNPRLSLLSCRRAISLAQLMGIHRPHDPATVETLDPESPRRTGFVWFRIVYLERFICLLLGLPSITHDARTICDETTRSYIESDPIQRLESFHSDIAAKVIRRNDKDTFLSNMETTHALDRELQAAAATMPPRWWTTPPDLVNPSGDSLPLEIVRHSIRLCNQIFHFFLVIQIHLPFMLRHAKDGTAASSSRMACLEASRSVLACFVSTRSNARQACSVPDAADFYALIAAMTLLLAHVDARRRDRGRDVLAYQRHADRDRVEEALEHMRDRSSMSADMLSVRSADVLRSLLAIEADAARGSTFTASLSPTSTSTSTPASCGVGGGGGGGGGHVGDSRNVLQLRIPCYGTVTISPDAPPSREPWVPSDRIQQPVSLETQRGEDTTSSEPNVLTGAPAPGDGSVAMMDVPGNPGSQLGQNADPTWLSGLGNPRWMGSGISAGLEDWPFQGVDAAFFDSMIRGFEESDSPM